jgi:hypothetical protein
MFQECRHIMPSGKKCHSPAMRSKAFCYYHLRAHEQRPGLVVRSGDAPLEVPFLEDRGAVQLALSEVVSALAGHRIDLKRAGLLIYALQVASSNAKNAGSFIAEEPVRDLSPNEHGELLGPETTAYDPDDPQYLDQAKEGDLTLAQLIMKEIRKRQAEQPPSLDQGQQAVAPKNDSAT